MRVYKVNRIEHPVFEELSEVPKDITIIDDWRTSQIGDWVQADDGCYIQILRKGKMVVPKGRNKVREYVGTCTGTFPVTSKVKMDTSRRLNIYSFGGSKSSADVLLDRTVLSKHEHLFVVYIASGLTPQEAYMKAFPTVTPGYAKQKSLFKLSDIMDLEDKSKTTVTQVSGALFQGFKDKELLTAERPKEIDG